MNSPLRLILVLAVWQTLAMADVRLSPFFTSNMVLQRDVPTRLTGWADKGESVRVKLGNRVVAETVGRGSQSTWTVTLPPLPAGEVPDLTVEGRNSITLTNLLAGELWVCSGQSNMEMTMAGGPWCTYGGVLNEAQEIAAADFPTIRLFTSGAKGGWTVCTPETVTAFSAAAYFFGRTLHQELGVPVGLVVAAVGGTPAEYWTPRAAREATPGFAEELARAKAVLGGELKRLFDSERRSVNEWRKAVAAAKKQGTPEPPRPDRLLTIEQEATVTTAIHTVSAGSGYEARVKPLTGMTVKGVIWYQGESNVPRADQYANLMQLLIAGWRADWNRPELPFLVMQLVNFRGGPGWPALRAAQQTVVDTVPDTAIAVGIDIGDPRDIHPKNKQAVGRRLALVALSQVYGQDLVASGPRVTGLRLRETAVVLSFDPGGVGQGLVLNGGGGFELAGADEVFQPAVAVLDGDTIVVQADSVGSPRAIRYAWEDNPDATLFNTAGLPAAPFLRPVAEPVANFQHTDFRVTPHDHDYHVVRGGLQNSRAVFAGTGRGRVAFLGGSITAMEGWRGLVQTGLTERFPQTEFDFVDAGISSIDTTLHACRFNRDVLKNGPVDLLIVEAAVNDAANGRSPIQQMRGMEGVVRQARLANPRIDIVLLHFADPDKLESIRRGERPQVIVSHERVAAHYDVPSVDLAQEVAERIQAGEFDWENDFKDLHPAPFGHELYSRSVARLFDAAWGGGAPADTVGDHPLPQPLDRLSYFSGRLVPLSAARIGKGFRLDPRWQPQDGALTREGFVAVPMLVAETPGASLELPFSGTGAGLLVASGPDAGTVEYRIDTGPWRTLDLYTRWSGRLHLPWAQLLAEDLPPGDHVLQLRVSDQAHPQSVGHAVRIVNFLTK
jgi:lysophospholipase L1-like esterase